MIILGIDPGTSKIGYAVLEKNDSNIKLLAYGCLEIKNKTQAKRLNEIDAFIRSLVPEFRPEILAIEKLFFTNNAKTALSVAEARGVIINSATNLNLTVREFTPLQVKMTVTGYGRAGKKEVQKMVCLTLKLDKTPQPDDASDAIAIALTACYTNPKLSA